MVKTLGRAALLALGLFVVQAVWSAVAMAGAAAQPGASVLPYVLASNLLIAAVLVRIAQRSPARGLPLLWPLGLVSAGIPVLYLLEAVFFDIGIPRHVLVTFFVQALVTGLAGAALGVLVVGKIGGASEALAPVPLRIGRLAGSTATYVVCYFVAGIIAWPFLRAYYETRPMPPVHLVFVLQIVRGLALSLIVWHLGRHEAAGRWPAALTAGLAFAIVGGIAPLIIPGNPYLPDPVRHAHLVEVGISNFVFGVVAARLLR
jgi:hypothetical protein